MSKYFPTPSEQSRHTIFPGVNIATCHTDNLMVSVVDLAPNSVVEEHSHPHEQVGMVVQGKAIFTIGDEQRTLQPGDVYLIPGNVKHKVVTLDQPTRAIDIFTPLRRDYL